jgi:hypothetical protein
MHYEQVLSYTKKRPGFIHGLTLEYVHLGSPKEPSLSYRIKVDFKTLAEIYPPYTVEGNIIKNVIPDPIPQEFREMPYITIEEGRKQSIKEYQNFDTALLFIRYEKTIYNPGSKKTYSHGLGWNGPLKVVEIKEKTTEKLSACPIPLYSDPKYFTQDNIDEVRILKAASKELYYYEAKWRGSTTFVPVYNPLTKDRATFQYLGQAESVLRNYVKWKGAIGFIQEVHIDENDLI